MVSRNYRDRRLKNFREYIEERINNDREAFNQRGTGSDRQSLQIFSEVYTRAMSVCEELERCEDSIDSLYLKTRPQKCLIKYGITTIAQLADKTEEELLRMRNFSSICLEQVKAKLSEKGISLKNE